MDRDTITSKINELKKEKNAVILVHNYQPAYVHAVADILGDSLDLSRRAAATDADLIVFCGVHFMAETAAILSPGRSVVMPDISAGCPMADMISAAELRTLKREHPDAVVITYVNSTADVKAESDYCCTSANAVKVASLVPEDREIIFAPDRNLGHYTMTQLDRDFILWAGYCPTHVRIMPEDVEAARAAHPGAPVVVHPECLPAVCAMADEVASTSGMVRFVGGTDAQEIIIGTEIGMIDRLKHDYPEKNCFPASDKAVCPNMKKTTLEDVLRVLETGENRITVEEHIAEKALRAINRMLEA